MVPCPQTGKDGVTEHELQDAVIQLARLLGWRVAHFRPAMTAHGWRTPVSADGAGFPDLVCAHPKQRRLLMVELKAADGRLSVEQAEWLAALDGICEVYVWYPRHWTDGTIEAVLRGESHPAVEAEINPRPALEPAA